MDNACRKCRNCGAPDPRMRACIYAAFQMTASASPNCPESKGHAHYHTYCARYGEERIVVSTDPMRALARDAVRRLNEQEFEKQLRRQSLSKGSIG